MEAYIYSEQRSKRYIKEVTIKDKEQYFLDVLNIENSFLGRLDVLQYNYFILESVELIIHAIDLFEKGYFDSAYYSLRQAIEIATTIIYLSDISEQKRKHNYQDWKETKKFPMQSQMLRELYQNGNVIFDMKQKMQNFFKETENISKKINKYVHKQGIQYFYVCRNHILINNSDTTRFTNTFEYYLKKVIGIVAVMRLAIDPYPILLMDKEIAYRNFDSITQPYTEKFVKKYIDEETIEDYKKTNIYKDMYHRHLKDEKLNQATYQIAQYKYIDTSKKEEILKQIHLLGFSDRCATFVAFSCKKVIRIYHDIIMFVYDTDRKNKIADRFYYDR